MRSARRDALVATAVLLFALALHARSLGHGFVNWDDEWIITHNPLFAAGGWTYVRAALTQVQFEAYHPLHLLSYLPDRWLWPKQAAGFHAVNLALFALDVLLSFRLARRHASAAAAAAATVLFAAHPLCVEAIDWISARKDLLAAAFFIGVLSIEDRRKAEETHGSAAGLALFAAAILSKTSALCLPPILWCWLRWMRGLGPRTASRRALPYGVVALFPALAVATIWRHHGMIAPRPDAAPIDVLATLATYARRTVWPTDLAPIYPVRMPAAVLAAVLAGVGALAVGVLWKRLSPQARFAALAFPSALLPVMNIVSINYRFADRYALLALVTLVSPLAVGIDSLLHGNRSKAVTIGALVVALIGFGRLTVRLTSTWASSSALWAHATAVHPDAYMARIKYGETLVALRDWQGARSEYLAAMKLLPLNYFGYAGLFFSYASEAEQKQQIPAGTSRAWRAAFDTAQSRASTFDAFIDQVPHDACPQCYDTLLLLRLRRWPRPDADLYRAAREALDEAHPDIALVLLAGAADQSAPLLRALAEEAARGLHRP